MKLELGSPLNENQNAGLRLFYARVNEELGNYHILSADNGTIPMLMEYAIHTGKGGRVRFELPIRIALDRAYAA